MGCYRALLRSYFNGDHRLLCSFSNVTHCF
jgi:hypothetical protein